MFVYDETYFVFSNIVIETIQNVSIKEWAFSIFCERAVFWRWLPSELLNNSKSINAT